MEARLRPGHGEKVSHPQALQAFLFQVSQSVSSAPLRIHLDLVKWPDIEKPLEACCQYNDNLIIMLVIPVVLPAVEGYLVVHPWVEEVKCPQIFFFLGSSHSSSSGMASSWGHFQPSGVAGHSGRVMMMSSIDSGGGVAAAAAGRGSNMPG